MAVPELIKSWWFDTGSGYSQAEGGMLHNALIRVLRLMTIGSYSRSKMPADNDKLGVLMNFVMERN